MGTGVKSAALLMYVAVAAGCAAQSNMTQSNESEMAPIVERDPAMLQLVSIAQNIHTRTAINDQILTKRYGIEDEAQLPIRSMPMDLQRIISFPGGQQLELNAAIKELARVGSLSYLHPQGTKPLSGIYVVFDDQLRTVGEYIADAARQAGFRADVVLDLSAKPSAAVQIQYKELML